MFPTIENLVKGSAKGNPVKPCCPYCNHWRVWRHGTYTRTGFHVHTKNNICVIQKIQRFICKLLSCGHSFSVLPPTVLPYCRFFLNDALAIFHSITNGTTAYSVTKGKSMPKLSAVLHFKTLFTKVSAWLRELLREASTCMTDDIASAITELLKHYSWGELQALWYRRIYPARYCK